MTVGEIFAAAIVLGVCLHLLLDFVRNVRRGR